MLQPQPNPRDQELLNYGLAEINAALHDGLITLKEWVRIRADWVHRIVDDPDEMIADAYADSCLDS